jgi:hypothetical protein
METKPYNIDDVLEKMKDMPLTRTIAMPRLCGCPKTHFDTFRVNEMCFTELQFFAQDPQYTIWFEVDGIDAYFHFVIKDASEQLLIDTTIIAPPGLPMTAVSAVLYVLAINAKERLTKNAS